MFLGVVKAEREAFAPYSLDNNLKTYLKLGFGEAKGFTKTLTNSFFPLELCFETNLEI
jgi:hypothetical protein